MYRIKCSRTFEAAHRLPNHDGKCSRLHGHSFRVTVVCRGPKLVGDGHERDDPKRGMLLDYGDLKVAMDVMIEKHLDHHYLNESLAEIAPWCAKVPTSENLARFLYTYLLMHVPFLYEVSIAETCTSECTYCPSEDDTYDP